MPISPIDFKLCVKDVNKKLNTNQKDTGNL